MTGAVTRIAAPCLMVLGLLAGCGNPDPPGRGAMAAVPWPDPGRFQPGVADALREARSRFEAARDEEGGQVPASAWASLGEVYQAHHLYELAARCYQNALVLAAAGDDSAAQADEWVYYAAVVAEESGRFDEAAAGYRQFLTARPDYTAARLRLARMALASGDVAAASASYREVLKTEPGNAAALAGMGRVALTRGDHASALDYLGRALAAQPGASRLYHPLAMARRASGDAGGAMQALASRGDREVSFADPLMSAISALSRSAQYYLAPALEAASDGRYAEAEGLFRRAISMDDTDPGAYAGLARVQEALGDLAGSMASVEAALALDPDHVVALYQKGVLLERGGDDAAAIGAYQRVLDLAPRYAEPRFLMAGALMREGRYLAAADAYQAVAETLPGDLRVHYRLGLAWLAEGQCERALAPLERASTLNPSYGPVVEALVRAYVSCPAASEAQRRQALEDARWLYSQLETPDFAEALAMALAANGEWHEAVALQETLVGKDAVNDAAGQWRASNLDRYRNRRMAAGAWPGGHAVFRPPPISASQRGTAQPSS